MTVLNPADVPTRSEWEDLDPEEWPRSEFDGYDEALRWIDAQESKKTAQTVNGLDHDARVYGTFVAALVLVFLASRGAADIADSFRY